jgi:hypothetical protein
MIRHHKLVVGVIGLTIGTLAVWYGLHQVRASAPIESSIVAAMGLFMVVDAIFDLRSFTRRRGD